MNVNRRCALATLGGALALISAAPVHADTNTIPGEGTFIVGRDVQPGVYISLGGKDGEDCIWYRHSTIGGDPYDIIADGSSTGQQYAKIATSDKTFETSNCQTWTLVQ